MSVRNIHDQIWLEENGGPCPDRPRSAQQLYNAVSNIARDLGLIATGAFVALAMTGALS